MQASGIIEAKDVLHTQFLNCLIWKRKNNFKLMEEEFGDICEAVSNEM